MDTQAWKNRAWELIQNDPNYIDTILGRVDATNADQRNLTIRTLTEMYREHQASPPAQTIVKWAELWSNGGKEGAKAGVLSQPPTETRHAPPIPGVRKPGETPTGEEPFINKPATFREWRAGEPTQLTPQEKKIEEARQKRLELQQIISQATPEMKAQAEQTLAQLEQKRREEIMTPKEDIGISPEGWHTVTSESGVTYKVPYKRYIERGMPISEPVAPFIKYKDVATPEEKAQGIRRWSSTGELSPDYERYLEDKKIYEEAQKHQHELLETRPVNIEDMAWEDLWVHGVDPWFKDVMTDANYYQTMKLNEGNPEAQKAFKQDYRKAYNQTWWEYNVMAGQAWYNDNKEQIAQANDHKMKGQATPEDLNLLQEFEKRKYIQRDFEGNAQLAGQVAMITFIVAMGAGTVAKAGYQSYQIQKAAKHMENIGKAYEAIDAGIATPEQVKMLDDYEKALKIANTYTPADIAKMHSVAPEDYDQKMQDKLSTPHTGNNPISHSLERLRQYTIQPTQTTTPTVTQTRPGNVEILANASKANLVLAKSGMPFINIYNLKQATEVADQFITSPTGIIQQVDKLPSVAMAEKLLSPDLFSGAPTIMELPPVISQGTPKMLVAFNSSLIVSAMEGLDYTTALETAIGAAQAFAPTVGTPETFHEILHEPTANVQQVIAVEPTNLGQLNNDPKGGGTPEVDEKVIQPLGTRLVQEFGSDKVHRIFGGTFYITRTADMSEEEVNQKINKVTKEIESTVGKIGDTPIKLKHLDETPKFPTIEVRQQGGKYAIKPTEKDRGVEEAYTGRGRGEGERAVARRIRGRPTVGDRSIPRSDSEYREEIRPAEAIPQVVLPQHSDPDPSVQGQVTYPKKLRVGAWEDPNKERVFQEVSIETEKGMDRLLELEDGSRAIIRADLNNFGTLMQEFPETTRWEDGDSQIVAPILQEAVNIFGNWVAVEGGDELYIVQPDGLTEEEFVDKFYQFADWLKGISVNDKTTGILGVIAYDSDVALSELKEAKPKGKTEFALLEPYKAEYSHYTQTEDGTWVARPKDPELQKAVLEGKATIKIAIQDPETDEIYKADRGMLHADLFQEHGIDLEKIDYNKHAGFFYEMEKPPGRRADILIEKRNLRDRERIRIEKIIEEGGQVPQTMLKEFPELVDKYREKHPEIIPDRLDEAYKLMRGKARLELEKAKGAETPETRLDFLRNARSLTGSEKGKEILDELIEASGGLIGDDGNIIDGFHKKYIGEPEKPKRNAWEQFQELSHRVYTEMVDWQHPLKRAVDDTKKAWDVAFKTMAQEGRLREGQLKRSARLATKAKDIPFREAIRITRAYLALQNKEMSLQKAAKLADIEYRTPTQVQQDFENKINSYPREILEFVKEENRNVDLDELQRTINYRADLAHAFIQRFLGTPGIVIAALEGGPYMMDEKGNVEFKGEPLTQIYQPVYKAKVGKQFEDYMLVRRNLEFAERGVPIPPEVIKNSEKTIAALKRDKNWELIDGSTKRVSRYLQLLLQEAVNVGLISQEQYDNIVSKNLAYIPYARILEIIGDEDALGFVDTGLDLTQGTKESVDYLKKVVGTEKPMKVRNPAQEVINYVARMVGAIERQRGFNALFSLNQQVKDAIGGAISSKAQENAQRAVKAMEQEIYAVDEGYELTKSEKEKGYKLIRVPVEGKMKWYRVHPELYKTITRIGGKQLGLIGQLCIKPLEIAANVKRLGITGLSPEFALLTNPIRDMIMQAIITPEFVVPFTTLPLGLFHLLKGKLDGNKMYLKYLVSGAGVSTMMEAMNLPQKGPKAMFEKVAGTKKWKQLGKLVADQNTPIPFAPLLAEVLNVTEVGSRLGLFAMEKLYGKADVIAAQRARRSSIDFAQHGRSQLAAFARKGTAYFNPNVQGLNEVLGSIRKRPISTILKLLAFTVAPSLLLMSTILRDKRKRKIYKELPEGDRYNYWIVIPEVSKRAAEALYGKGYTRVQEVDGHYYLVLRLAKPLEAGTFATLMERSLDWATSDDPSVLEELPRLIFKQLLPPLIPSLAQPFIETELYGKSFYTERPIEPEYMKGLPPKQRYTPWTPQPYVALGEKLGVSPTKLQHWFYGLTGTLGSTGMEAIDKPMRELGVGPRRGERPTRPLAQQPGFRKVVKIPQVGYGTATAAEYGRERLKKIEPAYNAINRNILGNWTEENLKNNTEFITDELIAYPLFNATQKHLAKIDAARRLIGNSWGISGDSKQELLYEINALTSDYITVAMDKYKEFKSEIPKMDQDKRIEYLLIHKDTKSETLEEEYMQQAAEPIFWGEIEKRKLVGTKIETQSRRGVLQVMEDALKEMEGALKKAKLEGDEELAQRILNEIEQAEEVLEGLE